MVLMQHLFPPHMDGFNHAVWLVEDCMIMDLSPFRVVLLWRFSSIVDAVTSFMNPNAIIWISHSSIE